MSDTEQVELWRGKFGDAYVDRINEDEKSQRARTHLWKTVLSALGDETLGSILEVGSNAGGNIGVLNSLTDAKLFAVEPNAKARKILISKNVIDEKNVLDGSASNIPIDDRAVDMVFTSGVLIHIAPDDLLEAYKEIYRVSRRYIISLEYFSSNPRTIPYHGHDNALFTRDFGRYWMENFPDLRIVDYGFCWKHVTGLDNLTWWIFEKT